MNTEPVRGIRVRNHLGWRPGPPAPSVTIVLTAILFIAVMVYFARYSLA